MSPGLNPGAGHHQAEVFWQNVSSAVGCTGGDLTCMRRVSFAALNSNASSLVSQYSYQMQPRVDGDFLPDYYEAALYQNQFNFTGPLVITHEQHEANSVPYAGVTTESDVINQLHIFFPGISDDVVQQFLTLYPASDYASQGLRFADMYQSLHHTSHDLALTHALKNQTWNAYIQIPPAKHGSDQPYYWCNGKACADPDNALKMKKYLMSFVLTGNPNTKWPSDKLSWPLYSSQKQGVQLVVNTTLADKTFQVLAGDDLDNARTSYWNKVLWY